MTEETKTTEATANTEPKVKKTTTKKAPTKKVEAKVEAPTKKVTGKMAKKITLIAKECPARKGTNRAKFWAKLKNGMTLDAAKDANVPLRFIGKMVRAKHITLG